MSMLAEGRLLPFTRGLNWCRYLHAECSLPVMICNRRHSHLFTIAKLVVGSWHTILDDRESNISKRKE